MADVPAARPAPPWWRDGVVYQIYPRSFADSDGDGVGDLEGIRRHIDHLTWLGVDALWLSPIYPSPMADFGYDVSDHQGIDPVFGDLAGFDRLLEDLHGNGLRLMLDWVPNHTSDQHAWFVASRSSRTDPKRDWYVWRDGRDGAEPNNWRAAFGGRAWTFDASTGQWYLHVFLPEQPDLDWSNPEVEAAMHDVLRFWLDRGVDGFRADVVHLIGKDPALADLAPEVSRWSPVGIHDYHGTHELLRGIRAVLDEYPGERAMVGEVNLGSAKLLAPYYGAGDELHLVFNFTLLRSPWDASRWTEVIEAAEEAFDRLGELARVGARQPRRASPAHPLWRRRAARPRGGGGVAHPPGHPVPVRRGRAGAARRRGSTRTPGGPRRARRLPRRRSPGPMATATAGRAIRGCRGRPRRPSAPSWPSGPTRTQCSGCIAASCGPGARRRRCAKARGSGSPRPTVCSPTSGCMAATAATVATVATCAAWWPTSASLMPPWRGRVPPGGWRWRRTCRPKGICGTAPWLRCRPSSWCRHEGAQRARAGQARERQLAGWRWGVGAQPPRSDGIMSDQIEHILTSPPDLVAATRLVGTRREGSLPLTAEDLRSEPSGNLFGLTQNVGMGWDPARAGGDQYLLLSTHGGLRADDGEPLALGYHTGHWEVGLLVRRAAETLREQGAVPFAAYCTDPCDGRSQGTAAMFDSLPYRNDAAIVLRRLARSLPLRKGILGVATCDKGLPAMLQAVAGLGHLPAVVVPGGVTLPAPDAEDLAKVQTIGARFAHGLISLEEAATMGCRACGSAGGGCQFLGTAATSQVVAEALGLALPHAALGALWRAGVARPRPPLRTRAPGPGGQRGDHPGRAEPGRRAQRPRGPRGVRRVDQPVAPRARRRGRRRAGTARPSTTGSRRTAPRPAWSTRCPTARATTRRSRCSWPVACPR